jgi:hypothetical protein
VFKNKVLLAFTLGTFLLYFLYLLPVPSHQAILQAIQQQINGLFVSLE